MTGQLELWHGRFHEIPSVRPTITGWDICVPTQRGLRVYKVQFDPGWLLSKFPVQDAFYWGWAMLEQKDGGQVYGAWQAWSQERDQWGDPVAA